MNIDPYLIINKNELSDARRDELRKEQAATDFEEIFARHLVNELTKDSFKFADNTNFGQSNNLYREFITDALASELAAQRRLGMAELIETFWNKISEKDSK
jgi:Rod binding domain-containing protein